MKTYNYITEIDKETFNKQVVIPCINNDGYRTILIKNKITNMHMSSYTTKYLLIKKNVVLTKDGEDYFCHIISCKYFDPYINRNFDVINDYIFNKIENPIDEYEFSELLSSIEQLFRKAPEDVENQQVGITGELLTLLYFYNQGHKDIINNYHKDFFSRHDIEISDKKKVEVKTTLDEKRIHKFNHDQLNNRSFDIYISSVKLFKSEKGMSLYQLFIDVIEKTTSHDTKFLLFKLMNYCNVDESTQGIIFSFENSISSVKLIRSSDIPQIVTEIPKGVSRISYYSDCEFVDEISISEILS